MIGPIAVEHGVTVAVEPLRHAECNVLNTVAEERTVCARGQSSRRAPAGRRLSLGAERRAGGIDHRGTGPLLVHAHIATYENRLAPARSRGHFSRSSLRSTRPDTVDGCQSKAVGRLTRLPLRWPMKPWPAFRSEKTWDADNAVIGPDQTDFFLKIRQQYPLYPCHPRPILVPFPTSVQPRKQHELPDPTVRRKRSQ